MACSPFLGSVVTSPSLQGNEGYILTLPGKSLDVSALVNKKKKFHSCGGKEGALAAMKKFRGIWIGKAHSKKNLKDQ